MQKIIINRDAVKTKIYKHLINKVVKIRITEINRHEKLNCLFLKKEEDKKSIIDSMLLNGYDKAHPIKCFIYDGKLYIYEGHTRYECAVECGLDYVWAYIDGEMTLEQAAKKTVDEQFNRRNVEDSDLVHLFIQLKEQGFSISEMSEKTHHSKRQLYKVQELLNKANTQDINLLKKGNASINEIYQKLKETEKEKQIEVEKAVQLEQEKIRECEEESIVIDEKQIDEELAKTENDIIHERHRELDARENKIDEMILAGVKFGIIGMLRGMKISDIINDLHNRKLHDVSSLLSDEDYDLFNSQMEDVQDVC